MPRLFIALEIPHDAALSLSLLRGGLPGARWIDTENYHLTLRFVGDVEGPIAADLATALHGIRRREFALALAGVGAFGNRKPRAVWAGVSASPDLHALQGEVDRACRRVGLPGDARKFTPHVTLARLRQPRVDEVARYLAGHGDFRTQAFTVDNFVLMSSRESVGGGPYIVEEDYGLLPARRGETPAEGAVRERRPAH
ncbi:RNA 2',3'-cyclic phosphodiesterase [Pararhizobium mangrovi]|uniref:RNA 2',3'-cyclic phosphodiesterase n=1 Tax=Pararhizobium mangrovi TaxID=2590452 RepID=A0A506U337_9HYPH|nr:RNA 2',3'-cyclic phosphodiesterase [Pararhizobium mangrovi]TPW26999.1 RNA 2',3'-cyclic phosphodiesterase [Pararhizobium mangrovi]